MVLREKKEKFNKISWEIIRSSKHRIFYLMLDFIFPAYLSKVDICFLINLPAAEAMPVGEFIFMKLFL